MSKEYTSFAIMILGVLLPKFGVNVDENALTTTLYTLIMIFSGVFGMVARYKKGDIKLSGARK